MEMAANPNLGFTATKNPSVNTPYYGVQFRMPIHRPKYEPFKPIQIKQPLRKRETKPVAAISDVLRLMDNLKLSVPVDLYTSLVRECTESGDPVQAVGLHEHITRTGLSFEVSLMNRVLLMFVSVGCLEYAHQVFDQMSERDFNSWAILIAGNFEKGNHEEAIKLFIEMICRKGWREIRRHDLISGILLCALKACLQIQNLELGRQIHGLSLKMGYSRRSLSNFLINFYGKLECSASAEIAFTQADTRNTIVWTSRIANSCYVRDYEEVMDLFKEMSREGVMRNAHTFSTVLKACGKTGDATFGKQLHGQVMKLGLDFDHYVVCGLVDLYGKHGFIKDATALFEMGHGTMNQACCNSILMSYIRNGQYGEAVKVVGEMEILGISPSVSVMNEVRFLRGGSFRHQ